MFGWVGGGLAGAELAGEAVGKDFSDEGDGLLLVPENVVAAPKRAFGSEGLGQGFGVTEVETVQFAEEFDAAMTEVASDRLVGMVEIVAQVVGIPPRDAVDKAIAAGRGEPHLAADGGAIEQGDGCGGTIAIGVDGAGIDEFGGDVAACQEAEVTGGIAVVEQQEPPTGGEGGDELFMLQIEGVGLPNRLDLQPVALDGGLEDR